MRAEKKEDILNFLKREKGMLSSFGVSKIGLFGSFVHSQQKSHSDIDILVSFLPSARNYDNFIGLAYFIEDHLERRVDLVTEESLSPYIGPHILKEVEYLAL